MVKGILRAASLILPLALALTAFVLAARRPALAADDEPIAFPEFGYASVLDPVTGAVTRLSTGGRRFALASWSPSLRWLAFGDRGEIYVMSRDGSETFNVTEHDFGVAVSAVWSPIRDELLYLTVRGSRATAWLYDMDTREIATLASDLTSDIGFPFWSPQGDRIAITMTERPGLISGATTPDIFIIDRASGIARNITVSSGKEFAPEWSSDGNRLVFIMRSGAATNVYSMNPDGSGLEQITFSGNSTGRALWALNDSAVLYTRPSRDGAHFNLLDLRTRRSVQIRSSLHDYYFISPSRTQVVFVTGNGDNTDLCVVNLWTGKERCFGVRPLPSTVAWWGN